MNIKIQKFSFRVITCNQIQIEVNDLSFEYLLTPQVEKTEKTGLPLKLNPKLANRVQLITLLNKSNAT